jgi:hypothetical protein
MQRVRLSCGLLAIAMGSAGLGGCHGGAVWARSGEAHGRYVGVGIYGPTAQWRQLVDDQKPSSPLAAQRQDDQVILVTADSTTGELRACGDLSGYCIGLNPWKQPLGAQQRSPVSVSAHGVGDAGTANTTADAEEAAPSDEPQPVRKAP